MANVVGDLNVREYTPESVTHVKHMLEKLASFYGDFEKHGLPYPIRPYQYEKIKKVLQGFTDQRNDLIEEKVIGDITPPAGGKTYMIAILAKLMLEEGIPTVISTYNSTAIFGEDNTWNLLEKMFSKDSVGVINALYKQSDKNIVITTPQGLVNNAEYFAKTHRTLNIILDEGDVFQTELRQESIDTLSRPNNFLSLYSATKVVSGRNIENWAHIVDEMSLTDLIELGHAKHIEGIYYMGDLTITDDNIEQNGLDYDSLKEVEQKFMIDSAYELYTKNHQGQKCIIHGGSAKQLTDMCAKFKEGGYNAEYVTYATPEGKRREIEEAYINGDLDILVGQAIYGRAFSEKGVTQVEIFAHITGSPTHLYQSILRGGRPNEKFDTLTIYQLLPSTLSTKSFVPIFMHDCFNIPLEDMGYWKDSDEDEEQHNKAKKPIIFTQKKSEEPSQKEQKGAKKKGEAVAKPIVNFASIIDLKKVIDTRAGYEAKLLYYVRENFLEMVDEFLKINAFTIQDIRKIDGNEAQTIMRVANINGSDENLTWHKVRMAVFSLITGEAKMYGRHNIALIDGFIQERYSTGKMPLLNARKEALDIKKAPSKKKEPVRKTLLQEKALEIFDLFINEHNMKETDLPRNLSDRSIQYIETICKFNYFLASILQGVTGYAPKVANAQRNTSWDMMWKWKNTGQKPDPVEIRKEVIKKSFNDGDYISKNFKDVIQLFLDKNYLRKEDIPHFNFKLLDKVTLTIDAEQMRTYMKGEGFDINFIDSIPDDFVYTQDYKWGDIIGKLTFQYCSDILKAERAKTGKKYEFRTNHNGSIMIQKHLDGTLTPETFRSLLTTPPTKNLPLAEDYKIFKNIEAIEIDNEKLLTNVEGLKWNSFAGKSFAFNHNNIVTHISGQRLCYIVSRCLSQMEVSDLAASVGFEGSFQTNKMTLEIFKKYINTSMLDRKKFDKEAIISYLTSIQHLIKRKDDDNMSREEVKKDIVSVIDEQKEEELFVVESMTPKDKDDDNELYQQIKLPKNIKHKIKAVMEKVPKNELKYFSNIKKNLCQSIFVDMDTLTSYGLNTRHYRKLRELLDNEDREEELMEDVTTKDNFFEVWVLEKMWG